MHGLEQQKISMYAFQEEIFLSLSHKLKFNDIQITNPDKNTKVSCTVFNVAHVADNYLVYIEKTVACSYT